MNDNDASPQSAAEIAREAQATARAHGFFQQWWFSLLVMALISVTTLLPHSVVDQLALQRDAVTGGEWWRIISSQFVHLGFNHTLLNIVGYLIIATAFREDVTPAEEAVSLLLANLGVGLGIYFFSLDIVWYVGLSGAIYGLLTHNLIVGYRRSPILSIFFGLFLAGKFYYEQFISGPDTATAAFIGADVAIDSHLYGAITGFVTGFISLLLFHRPHVAPAEPDRAN